MRKKICVNIFLLITMIILFIIGYYCENNLYREISALIGGTILGYLIEVLINKLYELDFAFLIQILLNWNNNIRISFSYLFRIQIDGTYFLIRGNKKKGFQPVGGVYQKYDGSKAVLQNIFQEDDEMKKGNERDLRGKVAGKDLKKFIQWFEGRHDREISCHREFNEELVKTGILNDTIFSEIRYSYLGTNRTKIFTSEYYGKEFLLAEIFELELDEAQKSEFLKLKNNYDTLEDNSELDYAFVTEEEIRTCHTNKRKKDDYEIDINNHTYKILKGEYK